jgi:hypothetical protein
MADKWRSYNPVRCRVWYLRRTGIALTVKKCTYSTVGGSCRDEILFQLDKDSARRKSAILKILNIKITYGTANTK